MLYPDVGAWIEKSDGRLRVKEERVEVGALVQVADLASKSKVLRDGQSPMFEADDVVNMKGKKGVNSRNSAVFASVVGTFSDEFAECFGNIKTHAR